jgi:hypothetical protein
VRGEEVISGRLSRSAYQNAEVASRPHKTKRIPTRKDERGDGPVGVLETDARTPDGPGDGRHRLLLPNDASVKHLLHLDQALSLVRGYLRGVGGGDGMGKGPAVAANQRIDQLHRPTASPLPPSRPLTFSMGIPVHCATIEAMSASVT